MAVKVLGTGCTNCKNTIALIDQVANAEGVTVKLEKIEDLRDSMGYGVMSTLGVVIDGKAVHAGGVPSRDKVDTDETDQRLKLLHENVKKFGTIFNTVAPGTDLQGVLIRKGANV